MTAKNQEYADLWDRLMENQAQRKAAASPDRALEIVQAQRTRDYAQYINDRDTLLRLYGDRDTRIVKSPVKLYDADHPRLPKPEERPKDGFMDGALFGAVFVAFVTVMALLVWMQW